MKSFIIILVTFLGCNIGAEETTPCTLSDISNDRKQNVYLETDVMPVLEGNSDWMVELHQKYLPIF